MATASPVIDHGSPTQSPLGAPIGLAAPGAPGVSPLAATGYLGSSPVAGAAGVPNVADSEPPGEEEATRAVSREELFRQQDAHVIVGDDALGDEATLAVPPGEVETLGIGARLAPGVDPLDSLGPKRESAPAFPPPPSFGQPNANISSGRMQAAPPPIASAMFQPPPPSWNGPPSREPSRESAPFSVPNPMSGPMPNPMPNSMPGPMSSPMSNPMPGMQPGMQMAPAPGYMPPHLQPTQQPNPGWPQGPGMQGPQGMQGPARAASPLANLGLPFKLTPQIIALIAVGTVCLGIFVLGVVLFFTTKF
jgi:hypothetical protein